MRTIVFSSYRTDDVDVDADTNTGSLNVSGSELYQLVPPSRFCVTYFREMRVLSIWLRMLWGHAQDRKVREKVSSYTLKLSIFLPSRT